MHIEIYLSKTNDIVIIDMMENIITFSLVSVGAMFLVTIVR